MVGINLEVITHKLEVNLDYSSVRQKQRKFALEQNKIINKEVEKQKHNGFVIEVYYLDWLANMAVVQKKNDKWHVCINFTDLNKVCLKDKFPLPKINLLVDTTIEHELLSFMDAYWNITKS